MPVVNPISDKEKVAVVADMLELVSAGSRDLLPEPRTGGYAALRGQRVFSLVKRKADRSKITKIRVNF